MSRSETSNERTTLDALSVVRSCRLLVTFAARRGGQLPDNLASDLRGTLGLALKEGCCSDACDGDCAYHYLFETRRPADAKALRSLREVPRPFVLRPPLSWPGRVCRGEILTFELVLIGEAAAYLPQLGAAITDLGERGLGRDRLPFSLVGISQLDRGLRGRTLFEGERQVAEPEREDTSRAPAELVGAVELSLELLTTTHVVANGRTVWQLPFEILVRALLRRTSSLAVLHCGAALELDFGAVIERARSVEVAETELEFERSTRYSAKQARRVPQEGIVGSVTYTGETLGAFAPLIALGQRIHVGKGTAFGMGRYVVV